MSRKGTGSQYLEGYFLAEGPDKSQVGPCLNRWKQLKRPVAEH